MPRSYLSEKEREASRRELQERRRRKKLESLIREKMAELHVTNEDIGTELGISSQAVGYKVRHLAFKYEELSIVFRLLRFENQEILLVMGESVDGKAERLMREEELREEGMMMAYRIGREAAAGEDDPLEAILNKVENE